MKKKVISSEHPIVKKKIDRTLKLSIREGALASVSTGLGLSYFSTFALALNATASQVGILFAVINLLPSFAQLKAGNLIEKFSRKKILLTGMFWKVLLWIPIILTGLLFYLGVPHMVWALIILVGIYYTIAALIHPAWFSWMGSLVPGEKRGHYFSKRNRVIGFFSIVTMIAGAIILDSAKSIGTQRGDVLGFTLLGFGLLFATSAITRIWSAGLLKKQYEPKLHVSRKDCFSFWDFLRQGTSTSFGKFVIFRGFLSFVVAISSPFWVVYMIRNLGFSYVWYMSITVAAIAFRLIFLPLLGKISDKYGNVKLIKICLWAISLAPLAWILSSIINGDLAVKIYLIIIPQLLAGFGWAGYDLAVNNYVYDAVRDTKRGFCVSYMNLVVGLAIFAGASIGSLLAWINISFMNPLLFIFAISAVGRFAVTVFGVKHLHEVRNVKKFSSNYLIKELHPVQGITREVHYLEHLVQKIEHCI